MKSFLYFISLIFFSICFNAEAYRIKGNVWFLSETVTNVNIYTLLYNAEEAARKGDNLKAAKILDDISTNDFVKNYVTTDSEPLSLALKSASLWYRAEYAKNKDDKIKEEAERIIEEWAEKAKNKRWDSYKRLYHRVRAYYVRNYDYKNLFLIQEKMILYDVHDESQLDSLESYCQKYPGDMNEMTGFITEFKKKGGKLTPSLELSLILESKKSDDDKFQALISWLKDHHSAKLEDIQKGVNKATLLISVNNLERVRIFHDTLTDLALWQPGNDERMPVIAYLINERSKIEAILSGESK